MTLRLAQPLTISLHGITNDAVDPGVDVWQQVTLPLIRQLAGIEKDELQMKVGHPQRIYAGTAGVNTSTNLLLHFAHIPRQHFHQSGARFVLHVCVLT